MLTLLAGVFIYITLAGTIDFQKTEGTVWERLKAAPKNRLTVLWGYLSSVAMAIVANASDIAGALNMPDVQAFIQTNVRPDYATYALGGIMIFTIATRLHALTKQTAA